MGKIMITTDSPSDFPKELIGKYNVRIIPLHVILGSESYMDGVDIVPEDIFRSYDESKILPKTSAVSIDEYATFFKDIMNEGYDEIVHIGMSSKLSSTYQNAVIATEDMKNVYVVDSQSLTSCLTMLVIKACELRDSGYSAKEIAERVKNILELPNGSFILDKLEFLHKGGRCSGVAAFGANVLGIKPCIDIADGGMAPGKKYRGKIEVCQLKYVADRLAEFGDRIDTERVFITSTADFNKEQIDNIVKEIKKHMKFKEIITSTAGCVVSSHCGKNTVGVLFMLKP